MADHHFSGGNQELPSETVARLRAAEPEIAAQDARYAIDGAIAYGRMGVKEPPQGHWLTEYWHIGKQLAELGKTSAWDNQTPVDSTDRAAPADKQRGGLTVELIADIVHENTGAHVNYGDAVRCARAVLARVAPSVPEGFTIKRVEGHGWLIDPPSGGRWVAHEGTPIADFITAMLTAAPQPSEQQAEQPVAALGFMRHALKLADRQEDSEIAYTLRQYLNAMRLAAPPAEQPAEEARGVGDAIAKSKRILALVDDYAERQTSERRTALRVALMNEFEALLAAPAAAPAQCGKCKPYRDATGELVAPPCRCKPATEQAEQREAP